MSASAISIESIDADVTSERCALDSERDQQVRMKFGQSNFSIAAKCRFGLNTKAIKEIVGHVTAPIVSAVSALGTSEQ
jgi:hypothetical protein